MNPADLYNLPRTSSSSAVDLTGISAPSSPLDTSRRRSWSKVEAGQDPLRFNTHSFSDEQSPPPTNTVNDDPFDSDDTDPYNRSSYSTYNHMYSSSQAGPSTASLIGAKDGGRAAEDEVRLTSREGDPEQAAASRTRRRTLRYSASPLKRTGTAIKSVSQNLRRISLRVVNLAGSGLERLEDDDDNTRDEDLPDLSQRMPIRGRTLCCLGPHSRVRLALYRALTYACVFTSFIQYKCL